MIMQHVELKPPAREERDEITVGFHAVPCASLEFPAVPHEHRTKRLVPKFNLENLQRPVWAEQYSV